MPPEELNNLEPILEAQTLQNEEIKANGEETNALLQALIAQGENDNDALIEAQIENDNQNTNKIVEAVKELKPELEKSASSTDRMVNFLEQMKGEPGHTPTEEELLALIEPRIPKVKDGEDGHTPTSEELVELIEPLVDEKMPTDEKLVELITPLIPPPIKPKDGIDGIDADEDVIVEKVLKKIPKPKPVKEIKLDTGEEIVAKLEKLKGNKRLDKSAIKGLDKMQKEIDHVASFSGSGQEYRIGGTKVSANSSTLNFIAGSNTTITGAPTSDGADITITATGGGGGAVDSVNGQTGVVVLDQDDIGDGTTYKQYSQTEKTKLAGIETGAEVNTIDTVSDTTEIDLTITARDLTATIRAGSIDETKLDTSVNASLDLADSALQSSAIGVSVQAYSSVLQNTTASFTTADETKIDNITVTQAVNLDTMESDIAALANGMVYKGNWDASAGTFPGAGAAQTGWFYTVSVGGTVDSVVFNVDDRLVATTDNASAAVYAGNWTKLDATDAVTSVFSRTGNVVSANGDYTASQITNVPAGGIAAITVQAALDELDSEKVQANAGITGATKTKITYDAKGLVTAGADATTADIADSTNKRYVTDADLTTIGNQSGTNTGNQTITNSSDATSHTVTLSASGGSVQLIEGSGVTLTTGGTGSAGTVTFAASGGSGDVVGPASATDGVPALFDTTTGKLLKNSTPTGTGNPVMQTSPDLTTPDINAATVDSLQAGTASAGVLVKNNAGTTVASFGVGGASSTNIALIGATVVTGNVSATNLSGTNTGDQTSVTGNAGTATALQTARTIGTLTGDVTSTGSSFDGTGNNTNSTTIANSAVTLAKMANLAQDQFIGRTTASTGVPETATITAAARTVLDDTTVGAMVDTLGGATATGTGGLVRATSPTLVTPALGTPSALVGTNITGTASGLTAGDSTKIGGITVTGTPAVGYIPTATSTSAATWQAPAGGGNPGWDFVSYNTASAAASITVSSLDLAAAGGMYQVIVKAEGTTACDYNMQFNSETAGYAWGITRNSFNGSAWTMNSSANNTGTDTGVFLAGTAADVKSLSATIYLSEVLKFDGTNTQIVADYTAIGTGTAGSNDAFEKNVGTGITTNIEANITSIKFLATAGTPNWKVWVFKAAVS